MAPSSHVSVVNYYVQLWDELHVWTLWNIGFTFLCFLQKMNLFLSGFDNFPGELVRAWFYKRFGTSVKDAITVFGY